MSENTKDLRTTTISLDEYNKLTTEVNTLKEKSGAQNQTIRHLEDKIVELNTQQPKIKVFHYDEDFDNWGDHNSFRNNKVEFINLTEVENLAKEKAKFEVEEKLKNLEAKNEDLKDELKFQKNMNEQTVIQLNDTITVLRREISKTSKDNLYTLKDKEDEYERNLANLNKSYKQDTTAYKETIKELKEEIQKIKDNKNDEEIEKKRNEEIKTLKGRINDLERILNDLKNTSFFKRIGKLRNITLEQNKAAQELRQKEWDAEKIGTTWVREGGKVRRYNYFDTMYNSLKKVYNDVYTWTFTSGL